MALPQPYPFTYKILYIMQPYTPLFYEQDGQHFRFVYFTGFKDFIMGSPAIKVEDAYDKCAELNEPQELKDVITITI